MAGAMPVGFVSSAQKTQEPQRWKVQYERQSRSFLTPGASMGYPSLPPHDADGRACTHRQQIKWNIPYEVTRKHFFIPFFSGMRVSVWGDRDTSNTVFSPGVLKIKKISEIWGGYSNYEETLTNLKVIKNIYVGPDSQVHRIWQINEKAW